jgi:P27 family predicted phage terminase small subunit
MGTRGPIPGAIGTTPGPKPDPDRLARLGKAPRKPRPRATAVEVIPTNRPTPDRPAHLQKLGRQVWADVWDRFGGSVLDPQLDLLVVRRLCELADLRAVAHAVLLKSPLLEEPIVSPSGAVVGTRVVANPMAAVMRAYDKEIDALSDRIGASPAARARLGLVVSRTAQAQADAQSILAHMYSKEGA